MIKAKKTEEIEKLRIGGQKLARILRMTAEQVKPGVDTKFINDFAHDLIIKEGGKSPFFGYTPYGAKRPFQLIFVFLLMMKLFTEFQMKTRKFYKKGILLV